MFAARLLYAEIGRELGRRRYDSVTQRAVVPWPRKARLLGDAMLAAATRAAADAGPGALPEAMFLIDALPAVDERLRRPRIEERVAWLVDLFERLEERERPYAGSLARTD
jgi:phytoene synthase